MAFGFPSLPTHPVGVRGSVPRDRLEQRRTLCCAPSSQLGPLPRGSSVPRANRIRQARPWSSMPRCAFILGQRGVDAGVVLGLWLRWGCPRSREPHFCESCSTQIQVPLGSCSVTLAFAASTFCSSSLCFYSRRTEMRCLVVFSSWREDKISRQRPPVPANQRLGVSLSPPLPISSRSPAGPVGSARQGSTQPPLARSLCRLTPMELCPPQRLSSLQSHFSGLLSGPSFNDLNETLSLLCPNHLVTVHKPRMKCGCLAPPGSFVWLRDSFRAQTPTHPQFPAFTSAAPSWKLAFSCFSRGRVPVICVPRAAVPPQGPPPTSFSVISVACPRWPPLPPSPAGISEASFLQITKPQP